MMRKILVKLAIAILITGSLVGGCSYINRKAGLEDDWFGEELLEDHIEVQTGIRIDLTPSSKEK